MTSLGRFLLFPVPQIAGEPKRVRYRDNLSYIDDRLGWELRKTQLVASILVVLLLALVSSTVGVVSLEFAILFGLGVLAGVCIARPSINLFGVMLAALAFIILTCPLEVFFIFLGVSLGLVMLGSMIPIFRRLHTLVLKKLETRAGPRPRFQELKPRISDWAGIEYRPAATEGFNPASEGERGDEPPAADGDPPGQYNLDWGCQRARSIRWDTVLKKIEAPELRLSVYGGGSHG